MSDREAEIQARLDAATPGPWVTAECPWKEATVSDVRAAVRGDHIACGGRDASDADIALIANAPTDLAYLLARVAELEARVAAVREAIEPTQLRPDLKDGWNLLREQVEGALEAAGLAVTEDTP